MAALALILAGLAPLAPAAKWLRDTQVPLPVAAVFGLAVAGAALVARYGFLERETRRLRDLVAELSARNQEHEQALEDAQEAVRLRNEFLSVASHELRSPVTSLRGYAQWLPRHLRTQALGEDRRIITALAVIERQSNRVAELIAQLLDLSRIEAGKLVLEREPVDLGVLATSVSTAVRVNAGTKRIVVRAPADSAVAHVDRSRIEQVVVNLLENAIKFDQSDKPIEVDVEVVGVGGEVGEGGEGEGGANDRHVRITVRDHGTGISEADRERMFQRYQQAHDGSHGGLGLGLFISREIVEAHGGRLEVESPPGGGTRMAMTLPTLPKASESLEGRQPDGEVAGRRNAPAHEPRVA